MEQSAQHHLLRICLLLFMRMNVGNMLYCCALKTKLVTQSLKRPLMYIDITNDFHRDIEGDIIVPVIRCSLRYIT